MEIELYPSVEILPGTFNVLIAPEDFAASAIRRLVNPRRFLILYVCGNYSRLLSRLNLREADFEIRRAFTASQLLTILDEAHHSFLFVEHDQNLFAESEEMIECASMTFREVSRESTVVLYAPFLDDSLQSISKKADRLFCFADLNSNMATSSRAPSHWKLRTKRNHGSSFYNQSTLEVF